MKKKKVLVHGTADSLKQFFADKVSNDYEIAAILTDDNISGNFEVFAPQNLPQFVYGLTDGIIFTDATEAIIKYFLETLTQDSHDLIIKAQGVREKFFQAVRCAVNQNFFSSQVISSFKVLIIIARTLLLVKFFCAFRR